MEKTKQSALFCAAVLGTSLTAFAQDGPRERAPNRNPVREAAEALALTRDQVNEIREIRRVRPPRHQAREERREWRKQQQSKLQSVLTEDQKDKLADLQAAQGKMRALLGASLLGLTGEQRPEGELLRQWSKHMCRDEGFRGARGSSPCVRGRGFRGWHKNPHRRGGFGREPNQFNCGRSIRGGPPSSPQHRWRWYRDRH